MSVYLTAAGVQQFSITIASGSTTGTATINAVGSGAFILNGGLNPSVFNNPAEDFAYLTLTNSTTITATRNTSTTGTVVVTGSIVDGSSSLIKTIQYGTVTIAATAGSGTATISSVTNTNTAVHLLGWSSANTTLSGINEYPFLALSGTTVTATIPSGVTGSGLTVGYVVIEFQTAALNQNVQNVNATDALSATSYTATISSVVTNNAISIYAGSNVAVVTTNVAEVKQYGSLTNSTTFTVNVNTAVANLKTYRCTVIEFVSGVLKSAVQRSTTTLTGVTSNTSTLSTVNQANTALSWLGNTTTATSAVLNQAEGASTFGLLLPKLLHNAANFANGSTSLSITTTSTTSGSLLAISINIDANSSATVTGITDNQSQTWIQVPGARATSNSGGGCTSDIWYFPNTTSGVTSVIVSFSTSVFVIATVIELANIVTSSPVDVSAALNNGASSLTATSSPITTSQAGDFIFLSYANTSGGQGVASPPYADINTENAYGYIPSTVVTNSSATITTVVAKPYCISTVAFLGTIPEVVTVTKNSATSNLTGSWEAIEFIGPVNTLAAGSSAGSVAVSGVGSSQFAAFGFASGSSTATATGASQAASVGSSIGISTVSATGTSLGNIASASGTCTVSGIGASLFNSIGSSAGTATAKGFAGSVGVSIGSSSVTATSASQSKGVGNAIGTSSVMGFDQSFGVSTGVATVSGVGSSINMSVGNASGSSNALGVGQAVKLSVGSSIGSSLISGVGLGSFPSVGNAVGQAIVNGYPYQPIFVIGSASGVAIVSAVGNIAPFTLPPEPIEEYIDILLPPIENPIQA